MKKQNNFKDLEKANAYIEEVNAALDAEIDGHQKQKEEVASIQQKFKSFGETQAVTMKAKDEEVASIQQKIKALGETHAEAMKAKDEEVASIQQKIKALGETQAEAMRAKDEEVNGMKDSLDQALEEVATLSEKLDLQEKHGGEGIVVTVNKKNYTLVGKSFITLSGEQTAEQLSVDTAELERLVDIGSGALVPIN